MKSFTKRWLAGALCALLCASAAHPRQDSAPNPVAGQPAQTSPAATNAKPDYSDEPFVFEQYSTKVRFENDGTGERDTTARIRVQSDAGVQALGELTFGYNSANERLDIQYIRVRKPDGTVVTAEATAVKEMTPQIERDAPVYTDYKEKHVTVPSLHAGDTLEYEVDTHVITPFAPGEFWYAQDFLGNAIILDETLEVNLPDGRAVRISSPGIDPLAKSENGRKIYTWKHAVLTRPSDNDQKSQDDSAKPKPADVQFSTFKSWREVGQWYASLEQGRADPSPEIRAKVTELTQGRTSELEKVQPLYDYVAKNIRYVSLSFGVGRYQPHTAAEVFANQYGDCKDKATLLAAMLRAAGIPSDVALIPATTKLDETMPSPSQFDHVITAVPQGADLIWIDSTAEVAPFRMLAPSLRAKSALLVPPDGAGRIVETPADPPFAALQNVTIEGTVSDLGKLTGTLHYVLRGDQELYLRLAFRHSAKSQWNQMGTEILAQDGLDGSATAVETSDPSDTRNPFEMTIHFSQDDFLPWTSKEPSVKLPLLSIGLPDATEDNAAPIELGSPLAVHVRLKLTLPANFKARAPVGIAVNRDYAEFKSAYTLDGQTLTAERSIDFKMRELSADRTSDYLAFTHAVASDENQSLHLQNASAGPAQIPDNAKVTDVMEAAETALRDGNRAAAILLLQRVLVLDPKKYEKTIWNDMGLAYTGQGQYDQAVAAFHKQLEINPYDQHTNRYLAVVLAVQQKFPESMAAFQKQLEIDPLDAEAHMGLGSLLLRQEKYAEALPELEKVAALKPDDAAAQTALGTAYLNTGQIDKAMDAFDQAVQRAPSPLEWNNVAYELSKKKVHLEKAQQYAESAVTTEAALLRNADLAHADASQVQRAQTISSYWDTLGWVHFQQGDLAGAQRYIRAAWLVSQHGAIGDHLAQIFAKQGQKDQAADMYAQALAARDPDPDTRAHMMLLLGGNQKIDAMIETARPELAAQRTFALGRLVDAKAEAKFEILLAPSGADGSSAKADDVKFLSGDDSLRPFADRLRSIDFGSMFPDASAAKLVAVGTLSCATAADCSFVLALPDDVHSLN